MEKISSPVTLYFLFLWNIRNSTIRSLTSKEYFEASETHEKFFHVYKKMWSFFSKAYFERSYDEWKIRKPWWAPQEFHWCPRKCHQELLSLSLPTPSTTLLCPPCCMYSELPLRSSAVSEMRYSFSSVLRSRQHNRTYTHTLNKLFKNKLFEFICCRKAICPEGMTDLPNRTLAHCALRWRKH